MRQASKWLGILALAALAACDQGGSAARGLGPTGPSAHTAASALTVSLLGPSPMHVGDTCPFYAYPDGGTAPYSYSWGVINGTGSSPVDGEFDATARAFPGTMTVQVTVTDALGAMASTYQNVSVTNTASFC